MKKLVQQLLCLSILLAATHCCAKGQPGKKPAVIFDTDMGPDYDDVGAIAILHALADNGECRILATMGSNRSPYISAVLSVMNTYFGRPSIPIGIVSEPAQHLSAVQKWDSLLVAKYPHSLADNAAANDAVALYRKILAAQPDQSVTIVTVGFFSNIANLLASGPDRLSRLDGRALVHKKVKMLVSMAGRFDSQAGTFREFNVMRDAAASVKVFEACPVPMLFSGFEIGAGLHTGLPLLADSSVVDSPVRDVFARSIPMDPNDREGRMSWDETAVLVAVRGPANYFNTVKGQIEPREDGSNGWNSAGKRDAYLVRKMPTPELEGVLNQLMKHRPVHH